MTEIIAHADGELQIIEMDNGLRRVTVRPADDSQFVPIYSCETTYPTDLIEKILAVKGIAWVCDELGRDEDPNYVSKYLLNDLAAYFAPSDIAGKRVLDFGCGSGASTAILAREYPDAEFTGVELRADLLEIAKARSAHYGLKNCSFIVSPDGSSLPPDLGEFDIVIMSAVVEHLLPNERPIILPLLWNRVKPGGYLFLDQTPYRYFPIELHTTMLPFINYLPDSLAFVYAKTFSKRINAGETWESLLRQGIRGATEKEIKKLLANSEMLICLGEVNDRIDLWLRNTNPNNMAAAKRLTKGVLKLLYKTTGICMVPDLALAFRKS
ncbi:MAG TPA: class I SAM-dependent methyltransferase [Pyrinomonadaceae bacterium]|nr:class I SAM-dependent methyltransferase [Pyrinomonadaceae bacterium]